MNQIPCHGQTCILRGTLKSAAERSSTGRTDVAYHRWRRIEIWEKFGPKWSHNKAVPGRPLQMQPADIEIYWKTWPRERKSERERKILAGREYMPGSQVTRRGSEGSRVVE